MTSKRIHKGSGAPHEVKEFAAHWAHHLEKAGVPFSTILKTMKKTRYVPCKKTLKTQMEEIKNNGKVHDHGNSSGRKSKLSDEKWSIVAGWILVQKDCVNFEDVLLWIQEHFNIKLSKAALSVNLRSLGLSAQLVGKRLTKSESFDDYCQGYLEFLLKVRDEKFMDHDPSKIICLDFITNSMRLDQETTIQMIGDKQQKMRRKSIVFTNSYLTPACYGEGLGLFSIMFTHDKAYKPNGPRANEVNSWFDKLELRRDQVVYVESNRAYCKECNEQISHFQAVFRDELVGTHIVYDAGNSFKLDGEDILEEDAEMVLVFPPEQHGELSVLDNKLHAVAKNRWRALRKNVDFSYDALLLLKCIMDVKQSDITGWWESNFMMNTKNLTLAKVKKHLSKVKGKEILRQAKKERYIESYIQFKQDNKE